MKNELKPIRYLFYARYSLTGLIVYDVITTNRFAVIGWLHSNSIELIERIDFNTYTPEREDVFKSRGIPIRKLDIDQLITRKLSEEQKRIFNNICGESCALYNSLGCPYAGDNNTGEYCDEWRYNYYEE